jgi:hypothetical protein
LIGIIARFPDALLQEVVSRVANKSGGLIMFIIEIVFLLLVIGAAILLVQPQKAYLTHISHLMGFHDEVQKMLPKNVYLAYDNLEIEIK